MTDAVRLFPDGEGFQGALFRFERQRMWEKLYICTIYVAYTHIEGIHISLFHTEKISASLQYWAVCRLRWGWALGLRWQCLKQQLQKWQEHWSSSSWASARCIMLNFLLLQSPHHTSTSQHLKSARMEPWGQYLDLAEPCRWPRWCLAAKWESGCSSGHLLDGILCKEWLLPIRQTMRICADLHGCFYKTEMECTGCNTTTKQQKPPHMLFSFPLSLFHVFSVLFLTSTIPSWTSWAQRLQPALHQNCLLISSLFCSHLPNKIPQIL